MCREFGIFFWEPGQVSAENETLSLSASISNAIFKISLGWFKLDRKHSDQFTSCDVKVKSEYNLCIAC